MPKSRLSAVLSLLLVFFSGGVLGAFAYRLYSTSSVHSGRDTGGPPRKLSPEEFRKKYISDLTNAVKIEIVGDQKSKATSLHHLLPAAAQ